jgi:hypothetical protein
LIESEDILSSFPENITAKLGFIVRAITREARRVIVITKGIENINFPIVQVIKSIDENIQTTVKVVVIKTL